jgi:DNA-binding transcriptional MocR family regulator
MAEPRPEAFQIALSGLRERLRDGSIAPGARITATDMADALRLSATPVREALSRLAGEGLVEERRGQGFFVRMLAAPDIADLYRLELAHLLIVQEPHRADGRPAAAPGPDEAAAGADPVRRVERLFAAWIAETGSRTLVAAFRMIQVQLGPVRRLERQLLPDLDGEAAALEAMRVAAARADLLAALRQFHLRRIRLAERLASLLDREGRRGPQI